MVAARMAQILMQCKCSLLIGRRYSCAWLQAVAAASSL